MNDLLTQPVDLFASLAIVLVAGVLCGLIVHAADWYTRLGRSRIVFRDPTLGRDQHRDERRAALDRAQSELRVQQLRAVVQASAAPSVPVHVVPMRSIRRPR